MTKKLSLDSKRAIQIAANSIPLIAVDAEGNEYRARVNGAANDFAGVTLPDTPGPATFEFAWETIERANNGEGRLRI